MAVETVFWFHPLAWWIGTRLVEERERACDEDVLAAGNDPHEYAEGILAICKRYVESPAICMAGVTGSDLKGRIEAILSERVARDLTLAKKSILLVAGVAALSIPIVTGIFHASPILAQTEKPLAFDAASIKPAGEPAGGRRGPSGGNVMLDPGRGSVTARRATARGIVREAYRVTDQQLSGGPNWLDSDWYTLEAKAETPATADDLREMLRTMLADRFRLAVHRESKPMPVYLMTVGKNGLKAPELKEGEPTPTHIPRRVPNGGPAMITSAGMPDFAYMLSRMPLLDRPVVDQTGLHGRYFFGVMWSEDEDFLTVMQEEFGLKFESRKAPVEVIVIDHIEKPSEN